MRSILFIKLKLEYNVDSGVIFNENCDLTEDEEMDEFLAYMGRYQEDDRKLV